MTAFRILAALGVAALLALGAVACGDDDDEDDNGAATVAPTRPATTPTRAATAPATAPADGTAPAGTAAASETLTVEAEDFSFSPDSLQADVGDPYTIVLENNGSNTHTLTVYEDEGFTTEVAGADTGRISGGASGQFDVTFDEAKTYSFRCEVHPSDMQGTITVE